MGYWDARQDIFALGERGLFRTRDVTRLGLSHGWLDLLAVKRHAWGVWSPRDYQPSLYEILQTRTPHLVFCRRTALFLQGHLKREPDVIEVTIGIAARRPITLGSGVEIYRSRRLEDGVCVLHHGAGLVPLRVHSPDRAQEDIHDDRRRLARRLRAGKPAIRNRSRDSWPMTTPNRDTFGNPVEAFYKLKRDYDRWWRASKRDEAHPRPWPKELEPKDAPVFAHNELVIPRPPEEVFAALTDAGRWPTYYPNAANVKLPDGKTHLEPWLRFTWSTFGTTQKSAVAEFEPNQALAWTADSFGTHAYHRWILEPADGGTRVVTEETQTGPTASLDRLLMNPGLHAAHELWLHRLREALCPEGL